MIDLPTMKRELSEKKRKAKKKELEYRIAQSEYDKLRLEIRELEGRIKRATTNLTVTDHALLRYMQRLSGLDIDSLKESLITEKLTLQVQTLGDGEYGLPQGGKAIIRDSKIITIY